MSRGVSPYHYKDGLKDGVPIGLGYLSVSFGFGITAIGAGLKALYTVLISMTNMTSAGQVAGVMIITAAGTLVEMILTQLVINLRYSLMGISLTQRLDCRCTTPHRLLMSFGMTDEIFALAASKPYPVGPSYFYGLMTCPYLGWTLGTLLGVLAGQILPYEMQLAMGVMIYAMFIAIILPPARKDKGVFFTVLSAIGLSCCLRYIPALKTISNGFAIIICAVISAAMMALICPVKEEEVGSDEA